MEAEPRWNAGSFLKIDGKKHSLYFDAVEILDTFIALEWKGDQA